MRSNEPIEQSIRQVSRQVSTDEILGNCRNHIESLQNLSYLISLEADHSVQVRLHVRMMEWHLQNLADVLLQPY